MTDRISGSTAFFYRRMVLATGLALAAVGTSVDAGRRAEAPTRVLFICDFGTAKSAIARELFRRRVQERGVAATAFSRGLAIEDHVTPRLRERLAQDGIDPARDAPMKLAPGDLAKADVIVSFAKLPDPVAKSLMRDWTSLGSVVTDYEHSMPDLKARIDRLIDDIVARRKAEQ